MRKTPVVLVPFLLLCVLTPSTAQSPPKQQRSGTALNLDSPSVLPRGSAAGRLGLRFFGGDEDLLYTSLGVHLGLGRGWEGVVRSSFANRRSLGLLSGSSIRHGGSDVEIAARYGGERPDSSASLSGLLGVSFASTPAQGGTLSVVPERCMR